MDVDELYGKTMGIVSYGTIGEHCADLARAFRHMKGPRQSPPP
jgi:phosphoglycerate dehydrogenase-like enzyme